ncbi:kinase-like domain-containing protein [Earliella scabrosa]|nr:kinase-like domain-containing protein [Earliella scabrosa]
MSSPVSRYDVYAKFTPTEEFWIDRHDFFYSRGYVLRPRYRPGWIPSWRLDPTMNILHAEDRLSFRVTCDQAYVMDARRLSDGKQVAIKKLSSDSNELRIGAYMSSEGLRQDTRNHCVPILDVLVDPNDPTMTFIVMPLLRYIDDPDFDTVGSILDCVEQLLEGLVFLHEHNIAHRQLINVFRDCAYRNIMMDASSIFPQGFHPITDMSLPNDITSTAPVLPRASVIVPYYYVDFGISTLFDADDRDRLVTGMYGLDRDVPELSDEIPYDPFKVDVFILGNMFRKTFLHQKYSNVDILSPLVARMLDQDPTARPSAIEALKHFRAISETVWTLKRLWRARRREEPLLAIPILDAVSLVGISQDFSCY